MLGVFLKGPGQTKKNKLLFDRVRREGKKKEGGLYRVRLIGQAELFNIGFTCRQEPSHASFTR